MADPIQRTNVVSLGIKTLLTQFRGQPNIEAILNSYLVQAQEIENMLFDLLILRRLEEAEGVQLDGIGDIVGELRLGKDDTDYRAAIFGRVRRNRSNGKAEELLFLFELILGDSFTFQLTEGNIACFLIHIIEPLTGPGVPAIGVVNAQLQQAKGGGIRAFTGYTLVDEADTFVYASGDVPEVDAQRGYADDTETTGGSYVDAVSA